MKNNAYLCGAKEKPNYSFQKLLIMKRSDFSSIMHAAWGFVRRNGFTLSEALKQAWALFRLKAKMRLGIVRFYFRKVDGSIREAWGTLSEAIVPPTLGCNRRENPTVQNYYDTEKAEWRCFKIANLINVA